MELKPAQKIRHRIYNFKFFPSFLLIILITTCFTLCIKKTITEKEENDWSNYTGYLSSADFKKAVIGKWNSVFENQGKENVNYLELTKQGNAIIKIRKENTVKIYGGNYETSFLRPPEKGNMTIANLTIKTSKMDILLSRVCFDRHNAFPYENIYLRIYEEPYGVLERIDY